MPVTEQEHQAEIPHTFENTAGKDILFEKSHEVIAHPPFP